MKTMSRKSFFTRLLLAVFQFILEVSEKKMNKNKKKKLS